MGQSSGRCDIPTRVAYEDNKSRFAPRIRYECPLGIAIQRVGNKVSILLRRSKWDHMNEDKLQAKYTSIQNAKIISNQAMHHLR